MSGPTSLVPYVVNWIALCQRGDRDLHYDRPGECKPFPGQSCVKNLVVATNLVVEAFFPFLPAFRPSLRGTLGTLAIATVKAANKTLLVGIMAHECSPIPIPEAAVSTSGDL